MLGILACGCLENSPGSDLLPSPEGWEMVEVDSEPVEGLLLAQGAYKKGDAAIMLFLYSSGNENTVENQVMAKAHEIIEEPDKTGGGVAGDFEIKALKKGSIIALYFDDGKTGYVVVSNNKSHLEDFLSALFDTVYIDI